MGNKAPREILDGAAKITVLKTKDGKDIPRKRKEEKKKKAHKKTRRPMEKRKFLLIHHYKASKETHLK